MKTLKITLPSIDLWTRASLIEHGIDPEAVYGYMFLVNSAGVPLEHHVAQGQGAKLFERLMCIKSGSGSTDERLRKAVIKAKAVTLIAITESSSTRVS